MLQKLLQHMEVQLGEDAPREDLVQDDGGTVRLAAGRKTVAMGCYTSICLGAATWMNGSCHIRRRSPCKTANQTFTDFYWV